MSMIVVLGTAQDGGYPQCGCFKDCCKEVWGDISRRRFATCLGIIDGNSKWFVDLTINFPDQLHSTRSISDFKGVIFTHAHIGHYFGISYLSKEIMDKKEVTFFVMPKMRNFLLGNQPFRDIVEKNKVVVMEVSKELKLSENVSIIPFLVPHRDEFSETIGVEIIGPKKRVLFIPDIDSWEQWKSKDIEKEVERVDLLFLDGTFYKDGELKGRDMSLISHPRVLDCVEKRFSNLKAEDKKKIHFIHLNHSNPLLNPQTSEYEYVEKEGFNVAKQFQSFGI